MKRVLVVYYSKTGSNRFLAEKVSEAVDGDIEQITPRQSAFPLVVLSSLIGFGAGNRALSKDPEDYDAVVIVGPIWMGHLPSPLRDVLRKYGRSIKQLYCATCCGGSDQQKDGKFGYEGVFSKVRGMMGDRVANCTAFPITLVVPEDQRGNDQAMMKTRLTEENFTGEIKERFDGFVEKVRA